MNRLQRPSEKIQLHLHYQRANQEGMFHRQKKSVGFFLVGYSKELSQVNQAAESLKYVIMHNIKSSCIRRCVFCQKMNFFFYIIFVLREQHFGFVVVFFFFCS